MPGDDVSDDFVIEPREIRRLPVATISSLREKSVVEFLKRPIVHSIAEIDKRIAEREQRLGRPFAVGGRPVIDRREAEHAPAPGEFRVGGIAWDCGEFSEPTHFIRRRGHEIPPPAQDFIGALLGIGGSAEHQLGSDRMEPKFKIDDNAKIAASAPQRPKQVSIFVRRWLGSGGRRPSRHRPPIGCRRKGHAFHVANLCRLTKSGRRRRSPKSAHPASRGRTVWLRRRRRPRWRRPRHRRGRVADRAERHSSTKDRSSDRRRRRHSPPRCGLQRERRPEGRYRGQRSRHAMTSAAFRQRAMAAGRRSIIPFQTILCSVVGRTPRFEEFAVQLASERVVHHGGISR